MSEEEKTYPGPRFLLFVGLGCLGFTVLMLVGTWLFAQWTTPYFKQRQERAKTTTAPSRPEPARN